MTALFGPQTSGAVITKPSSAQIQRYGGVQTWFKDCSGPGASDGTVPDAAFFNRIVGALDYICGASGVSAIAGDDSVLYRAVLQIVSQDAPDALNSLRELADAIADDPNFAGTIMSMLANRLRFDQAQFLNSTQKAQAVSNLGLANVAVSGDYNALINLPTLGTAASKNVGTGANNVVQLDSGAKIPALDGSQLTSIMNRKALGASQDFNAVTAIGSYYTVDTTPVNAPVTGSNFYLTVEPHSDATQYVKQTATRRGDAATWVRVMTAGTWSAWFQFVELDATGKLPAIDASQLINVTPGTGALRYDTAQGTLTTAQKIQAQNNAGFATTTAPATGMSGELVTSGTITANFTTSATAQNFGSITLQPGVWDIEVAGNFNGSGSTTSSDWTTAISTTNNSVSLGNSIYVWHQRAPGGLDYAWQVAIPRRRVVVTVATTYYLNAQATFSGSTFGFNGEIQARRV